MFKRIITLLSICFLPIISQAQQWLGIANSNYAGTNAIYVNPANVTDSRYKFYLNIAANDAFATNSYFGWNAPYSYLSLFTNSVSNTYRNAKGVIVYKDEYLSPNSSRSFESVYALTDTRGPSALYTINDTRSVALTTRVRAGMSATNVDSDFAQAMYYGIDNIQPSTIGYDLKNMMVNLNSYAEVGITYGQTLVDNDEEYIKVGITAKRLAGIYAAYALINEANYQIIPDFRNPVNNTLLINSLKLQYGYTDEDALKSANPSLGWLLGGNSAGGGWGLDLGFVYEYRPDINKYTYREKGKRKLDASKNKYKYKFGVSLNDIGYLNYNNQFYANSWDLAINNTAFTREDFRGSRGFDALFTQINNKLGAGPGNNEQQFMTILPATLQVTADYQVKPHVYVAGYWVQNLTNSKTRGLRTPSLLSVTPRYERKWIEVSMPLVLFDNYTKFGFGLATRLGPVFVGTDNLGSLLNLGKPKGFDAYFGVNLPIFNAGPTLPNSCWYEDEGKKSFLQKLMFWKR